MQLTLTRRDILSLVPGAIALGTVGRSAWSQPAMPTRAIPSTGERLPIIGLGSTKPVTAIAEDGPDGLAAVLRALVAHGGRVVDTWPRNSANDSAFGRIMSEPDLRGRLFVTANLEQEDRAAGAAQFERALESYNRDSIDLANVGSLIGLESQWPNLREFKDRGQARYIGVTAAQSALYERLESFLSRETPDFVEINYSVTEREAERRFLPMLAERGIAVLISRPFMNGAYFERLENEPLPAWASEFECTSWAQFSLQYILANRDLTCVLTETTNPEHMAENAMTAGLPVPDSAARRRMRAFIDSL